MAIHHTILTSVNLSVESPQSLHKMLASSSEFMSNWLAQFNEAKDMYKSRGYEIISDNWQTGEIVAKKILKSDSSDE